MLQFGNQPISEKNLSASGQSQFSPFPCSVLEDTLSEYTEHLRPTSSVMSINQYFGPYTQAKCVKMMACSATSYSCDG